MANKLTNLNDHLFSQIERLSDESLEGEKLKDEIARSKSVTDVAAKIICNAQVALDAEKLRVEWHGSALQVPKMLERD